MTPKPLTLEQVQELRKVRWSSSITLEDDRKFLIIDILDTCEAALVALQDIERFHRVRSNDKTFAELEKKYGFLGWTCCGQMEAIAKNFLDGGRP